MRNQEIDPSDYESAVARAEFTLEQARLSLAQEEARGEQAKKEWSSLSKGEASPLALREPQLQAEAANVEWAEAALDKARRDLDRTTIRAQFAGMVREKRADVGQYVTVRVLRRLFLDGHRVEIFGPSRGDHSTLRQA